MNLHREIGGAIIAIEQGAKDTATEILTGIQRYLEEQNARQFKAAAGALSYSEQQAIDLIIDRLGDGGGEIVSSQIADQNGITRSVIVTAIRKLQSAGIIQSRSMGMKGTVIKPLVPNWREGLKKAFAA